MPGKILNASSKEAKQQFYKVIDTKNGNYGLKYKLGLNVDPIARNLATIPSCAMGAIYFTTAKNIGDFAGRGDSIAWITPVGNFQQDGAKYRASKIKITKILPSKKAVFQIQGLSPEDYESFGVELSTKQVLSSRVFTNVQKIEHLYDTDRYSQIFSLALKSSKDPEVISLLKDLAVEWNYREVKIIVKNNAPELINYDTVYSAFGETNRNFIKLLMQIVPDICTEVIIDRF